MRTLILAACLGLLAPLAASGLARAQPATVNTLVMLVAQQGQTQYEYTDVTAETAGFFTGTDSVAAFWDNASFGQMQVTGQVTGWLVVAPFDGTNGCPLSQISQESLAAAQAQGVDTAAYDHYVFVTASAPGCGNGGVGGGTMTSGNAWVFAHEGAPYLVTKHEFGHSVGFPHSGTTTCLEATCPRNETGDFTDIMGDGATADIPPNAAALTGHGWLTPTQVTASGTWTVPDTNAAGALEFTAGGQPVFIDRRGNEFNGAIWLHTLDGDHSYLVSNGDPYYPYGILPGYRFYDAASALEIDGVSATQVQVTFDAPPPAPDTVAPTAPTGLTATYSKRFKQTDLSWQPATDNHMVYTYRVYRDGVLVSESAAVSYEGPANTSFADGTPGTHTWYVTATDQDGNVSPASNPVTATNPVK